MGGLHDMDKLKTSGQMTGQEIVDRTKNSPDATRKKLARLAEKYPDVFPDKSWSIERLFNAEQSAMLTGKKRTIVRTKDETKPSTPREAKQPPVQGPEVASRIKWPTFAQVRNILIGGLLIAGVVGHAVLVWYDLAILYHTAGLIGGAGVFAIVVAAVLLAFDSEKYSTSGDALIFVFFVDFAAWWVHFEVFKTPGVSDIITGALCAFICAASFFALYLFRQFKFSF